MKRGFALYVAIFAVLVMSILIGGVISYASYATRATARAIDETKCRLAAQSAIEAAKYEITRGFYDYINNAGNVKITPRKSTAYDWFEKVGAARRSIGVGTGFEVTLPAATNICGVTVKARIGYGIVHAANDSEAVLPIVATATVTSAAGGKTSVTLLERCCYGTSRSGVFNYAYFVNNYGWMNGSSIVINGDMRANGNISLTGSTVNGYIIGAVNDELGTDGRVTLSSSPKIYSKATYYSKASSSARATNPPSDNWLENYGGGFEAPDSSTASSSSSGGYGGWGGYGGSSSSSGTYTITDSLKSETDKLIVQEASKTLAMPYISDLSDYIDYAVEEGGTLYIPSWSVTDAAGRTYSGGGALVAAHYDGAGPTGDVTMADNGALVLIGTDSNPIVLNGPFVVDSDIIIAGVVTGQGTLYSGRNIHVIGNITYKNAPSWTHSASTLVSEINARAEANASADMLGLCAKGNVVIGDYSTSNWQSTILPYIRPSSNSSVVMAYTCDESDADIGYPVNFDGDYTQVESTGSKEKVRTSVSSQRVSLGRGQYTTVYTYGDAANAADRRYYESVTDDLIVSALYNANGGSTGITKINAVIYNNHGVFGNPGKSGYTTSINGSLVCRDEAMVFSGNGLTFNWDMRLYESGAEGVSNDNVGLPVGAADFYTLVETESWQQVPDEFNPAAESEASE